MVINRNTIFTICQKSNSTATLVRLNTLLYSVLVFFIDQSCNEWHFEASIIKTFLLLFDFQIRMIPVAYELTLLNLFLDTLELKAC